MARGMVHYTRQKNKGALILKSISEVNQYCMFVAGVVGELLENLFHAASENGSERSHKNLLQAYHFGLFLQKINILKDQWSDEKEGRYFVPHRQALLKSVVEHARNAVDYLKSISQPDMGYRLFCAFSLFLGIATLPALTQAAGAGDANKISRQEAKELMGQLQSVIHSNEEVEKLYVNFINQLGSEEPIVISKTSNIEVVATSEPVASLHNLYEGDVSSEEWKTLVN